MFRIGIFLNLAQCIILLIAGDKISNYIIPFAVFASIGNAFYYYPQQILIKRVNKESNFQNYITKDQLINVSRSIGYVILIIISKIGFNLNIIACLIVAFTLVYIAFAYTLNKITTKYLI